MKNVFKEGDKVFCILYGHGTVLSIDPFDLYSISVLFESGNEEVYTNTGCYDINTKVTLSFTEYTLQGFSQERPENLPEKGQVVWVRDDEDDEWLISHFVEQNGNFYGTTDANPFVGIIETNWRYLTTKNPYENEK